MLLLWDHVVKPRAGELARLTRAELGELATSTIEGTTELLDPPFTEYCPPEVAQLIVSATQDCRASAPEWRLDQAYVTQFSASIEAVLDLPQRPGCGPLTMAALSLVDGVAGDLAVETVLEVLSSCYEAVLVSQLTGRVSTEREQQNERCQRALALQQDLISRFAR